MNGFYTCLLGNAVTALALTQPLWVSVVLLVAVALVTMWVERAHVERFFRKETKS